MDFQEIEVFNIILSENLFQTWTLWSGAMYVHSSLSHGKVESTYIAPLWWLQVSNWFLERIIFFQIGIKFSYFKTWYKISNKLKWIFKTEKFWVLEVIYLKALLAVLRYKGFYCKQKPRNLGPCWAVVQLHFQSI